MPGDELKKVHSGQEFEMPARTFNTFVDSARDFTNRRHNLARRPQRDFLVQQTGIVLIKNASGADRARFDVLGIDGPLFGPDANLSEFKSRRNLTGTTPTESAHLGKFAVLIEPIAAGKLGRAVTSGITTARLHVDDADHEFADVNDGDPGSLKSAQTGAAQILWTDAGANPVWAVVKISIGTPQTASGSKWAEAQTDWEENAGDPRVYCKRCDRDGGNVRGTAFYVYLPRKRAEATGLDPSVYADDVISYSLDEAGVPICRSPYLWSKIGDISMQKSAARIPTGWRECDATGDAWDMKHRFPMGRDTGGETGETAAGDTGGYRWHGKTSEGVTVNNHPDHLIVTGRTVDPEVGPYAEVHKAENWPDVDVYEHKGPFNSTCDTDNRPPWKVVIFTERWK